LPKNKLIAYPGIENSSYNNLYAVGKSLFIKYVYHYTGVNPETGIYTFQTTNADGNPTAPGDFVISQPVTQKYFGGFQNTFQYKGFQLDVFFQFVKQLGYNYISTLNNFPGFNNQNQPAVVLGRWQAAGDKTNIQQFTSTFGTAGNAYANLQLSDAAIADASFVRLKNLSLSYEMPSAWKQKMRLKNVKIFVQGQNLLTFTKYVGLDPETQGLNLPPLRIITLGLQATL
jgi:hypothetical protein